MFIIRFLQSGKLMQDSFFCTFFQSANIRFFLKIVNCEQQMKAKKDEFYIVDQLRFSQFLQDKAKIPNS